MINDLRIAARRCIREGRFTASAVIALALAIAITTTVFALMYGLVLRDLPVQGAERLISLGTRVGPGPDLQHMTVSYPDFADWQRATTTFSDLVLFSDTAMNVTEPGHSAERFVGPYVTPNIFRLLREQPLIGRDFQEQDDVDGAPAVVIISHKLWRRRYGGDPGVLGKKLLVNSQPATIIGVMGEGVGFPSVSGPTDFWMPLAQLPGARTRPRDARTFMAVGRLAEGVTLAQARADLSGVAERLASQFPATNKDASPTLMSYHDRFTAPQLRVTAFGMMGAAGAVLLLAITNVIAVLLARSAKRGKEVGVRMALGGSHARLAREVAADGVLLGVASSVVGLPLSVAGVRLLSAGLADVPMPYWTRFEFDGPTFLFAITICTVITGLLGLFSLSRVSSRRLLEVIRPSSAALRRRSAGVLIAVDVALMLMVLTGAGLLARSAVLVSRPAFGGINTNDWLTMRLALPRQKYASPEQRREFYRLLEEQLTATNGLETAAIMSHLPMIFGNTRRLAVDGRAPESGPETTVTIVHTSAGYFDALGLGATRGRTFRPGNGPSGAAPAVVNEIFASTHLNAQDPIGHHITLTDPLRPKEPLSLLIVGVVPNVRQRNQQQLNPDPVVYVPLAVEPIAAAVIVVRARPAAAAAKLVRDVLDTIDRDLPLFQVLPFRQLLANFFFATRAIAAIFIVFGIVALLICAIGIYAVIGAALRERQLEFGIRLAIGARPREIVGLIFRGTAIPVALGLVVGALGAVAVGNALATIIFQVSRFDAASIAGALSGLVLVYLASVLPPAMRASALAPGPVLRQD